MKSSTEYTELFGLRIALQYAKQSGASTEVVAWLSARITQLEAM